MIEIGPNLRDALTVIASCVVISIGCLSFLGPVVIVRREKAKQ